MANAEIEGKTIKENKKNELTITCKKAVCLVISQRDIPRHKLQIIDIKIKQVKKKYLGDVIKDRGIRFEK